MFSRASARSGSSTWPVPGLSKKFAIGVSLYLTAGTSQELLGKLLVSLNCIVCTFSLFLSCDDTFTSLGSDDSAGHEPSSLYRVGKDRANVQSGHFVSAQEVDAVCNASCETRQWLCNQGTSEALQQFESLLDQRSSRTSNKYPRTRRPCSRHRSHRSKFQLAPSTYLSMSPWSGHLRQRASQLVLNLRMSAIAASLTPTAAQNSMSSCRIDNCATQRSARLFHYLSRVSCHIQRKIHGLRYRLCG